MLRVEFSSFIFREADISKVSVQIGLENSSCTVEVFDPLGDVAKKLFTTSERTGGITNSFTENKEKTDTPESDSTPVTTVNTNNSGYGTFKEIEQNILTAAKEFGLTDKAVIAFAIGTARHESGDGNFPTALWDGKGWQARYEGNITDLGNTQKGDGYKFRDRGYTQICGRYSYERYGKLLGVDLINNPELATRPDIAAKTLILAVTKYPPTSRPLSQWVGNGKTDFYGGRRTINALIPSQAKSAAEKAQKAYENIDSLIAKYGGVKTVETTNKIENTTPTTHTQTTLSSIKGNPIKIIYKDSQGVSYSWVFYHNSTEVNDKKNVVLLGVSPALKFDKIPANNVYQNIKISDLIAIIERNYGVRIDPKGVKDNGEKIYLTQKGLTDLELLKTQVSSRGCVLSYNPSTGVLEVKRPQVTSKGLHIPISAVTSFTFTDTSENKPLVQGLGSVTTRSKPIDEK